MPLIFLLLVLQIFSKKINFSKKLLWHSVGIESGPRYFSSNAALHIDAIGESSVCFFFLGFHRIRVYFFLLNHPLKTKKVTWTLRDPASSAPWKYLILEKILPLTFVGCVQNSRISVRFPTYVQHIL